MANQEQTNAVAQAEQKTPVISQLAGQPPQTNPAATTSDEDPFFSTKKPQNPNRFYAFPLLGIVVKVILLIPVFIFAYILTLYSGFITIINSFVVFFSGTYWTHAYNMQQGLICYMSKLSCYFAGITDTYPGFSLRPSDSFSITIPFPQKPGRLYAIPLLGGIIKGAMIIPFALYQFIIQLGLFPALIFASFRVLFKKNYPESAFEFIRDGLKLQLRLMVFSYGLSDEYPSLLISGNHKMAKILFILFGVTLIGINIVTI